MNSQTFISQTPQYNDNDSAGINTLRTSDPMADTPESATNHAATMHQAIKQTINSHKTGY